MPTYRILLEYNGAAYSGWQVQPGRSTIQAEVERALGTALRRPIPVVGSGRTDAGVHARGQVAHFQADAVDDLFRLCGSLNGLLPRDIVVLAVEEAPERFHARYDARRRTYHYHATTAPRALDRHVRWLLRPAPDFERMNEASRAFLGTHNFSAFCRTASETENRICTVERAAWTSETRRGDWRFEIVADRFLHGMVRAIVGTLVQIGRGALPTGCIPEVLLGGDRRGAGPAAPAHGLVLEAVTYDIPFRST